MFAPVWSQLWSQLVSAGFRLPCPLFRTYCAAFPAALEHFQTVVLEFDTERHPRAGLTRGLMRSWASCRQALLVLCSFSTLHGCHIDQVGSATYLATEKPTLGRLFHLKRRLKSVQAQNELDHFFYLVLLAAGWVIGGHGECTPVAGTAI